MKISTYGLCIVSDQYFSDFPSIRHMSNKHENRPYYLAIKRENGIIWIVPLSSRVDKYQAKIKEDESKHGECIFYYVANLKGNPSAFLIGNTIPVIEDYIKKPFMINGSPFVIEDKRDIKRIQSKLSRYLTMVRYGKLRPAVDILSIERSLISRMGESSNIV